jgi:hypothetical protein
VDTDFQFEEAHSDFAAWPTFHGSSSAIRLQPDRLSQAERSGSGGLPPARVRRIADHRINRISRITELLPWNVAQSQCPTAVHNGA